MRVIADFKESDLAKLKLIFIASGIKTFDEVETLVGDIADKDIMIDFGKLGEEEEKIKISLLTIAVASIL